MDELFREIVHEIASKPLNFIVEIAQFIILVFLIKIIGFGFGRKLFL